MSLGRRYHEATKYSPDTILDHPELDWDAKPPLTKSFHGAQIFPLAEVLDVHCADGCEGEETPRLSDDVCRGGFDLGKLSTLLLHTYGVTAIANDGSCEHAFRAAPSAGALYPNEIYIALRGLPELPDGLYNYQAEEHALALICEGDYRGDLCHQVFDQRVVNACAVILVSTVFFRSAWRYAERGYRRVLLDSGHLIANAIAIAPALRLEISSRVTFDDEALASLLLLQEEKEALIAAMFLFEEGKAPSYRPAGRSPELPEPAPSAATEFPLTWEIHRRSYTCTYSDPTPGIRDQVEPTSIGQTNDFETLDPSDIDWSEHLCPAILLRRSARIFSPVPMRRRELATILDHALVRVGKSASHPPLFAAGTLRQFVAVNHVAGLEPGLYEFRAEPFGLVPIRHGEFAKDCCHIALGQEMTLTAAAVIFQVADLDRVTSTFGERGYRYVSLDAGRIGQRMSHAAEAIGLGSCAVGGYFDDQANELFGLDAEDAILFMTCLGARA